VPFDCPAPLRWSFQEFDRASLEALLTLTDLHPYPLAFRQFAQSAASKRCRMHENILAAVILAYEAKPFLAVVHFHTAEGFRYRPELSITSTSSMADPRCRQLEDLHRQYLGVSLTSDQQALKRKLVAWYNANCRERRASR
jgi:hypothetical protein